MPSSLNTPEQRTVGPSTPLATRVPSTFQNLWKNPTLGENLKTQSSQGLPLLPSPRARELQPNAPRLDELSLKHSRSSLEAPARSRSFTLTATTLTISLSTFFFSFFFSPFFLSFSLVSFVETRKEWFLYLMKWRELLHDRG